MAMGPGSRAGEINVTPMIDILLVLIIMFLVITPVASTGLKSQVPEPPPNDASVPVKPSDDLVIEIGADRSIRLNQSPVQPQELGDRLRDAFKFRPGRVVFVRGSADLQFGDVARVIDIAKGAGYDRVALAR